MSLRRGAILLSLCAGMAWSQALADGPGGYGARHKEAETEYQRSARDAYGVGYALIESASRLDHDAAAAANERIRRTASAQAIAKYEDALEAFEKAARLEPGMYEAHTYIGYVNRKLGRYERSLRSYEVALRLKTDYARAIQYQGEAYLGLNRFERAQFNYLRLYALDAFQARQLLDAMRLWVDKRRLASNGVSPQAIDAAAHWLDERRGDQHPAGGALDGW